MRMYLSFETKKMNKLFSEFKAVSKKEWKSKIKSDLKGLDFEKNLISTSENIKNFPFYHKDDNCKTFSSVFPMQKSSPNRYGFS